MKLLLTSNGISNPSIAKSLRKLLGKPFSKSKLVFIPTAANIKSEDKDWLIRDLNNCSKLGFKEIDILNIDATPQKKIWRPRIKDADVLLFGGGNTFYLMHWLKKSGLAKMLPKLLKTKVYVGISAGSVATGPNLSSLRIFYKEKTTRPYTEESLKFVNFYICLHLNSPHFPLARKNYLAKIAKKFKKPLYAIDDDSAVEVINGKIKLVGRGKYLIF